ncbi:hypothetical protein DICVIV_01003 [Dictyocaulus viviparus]|uniref:Uncharacterized protein n=1 Tax=Dictyocaulus viviparus TaxID=29172 RepID=A0A0D8YDW0_DICVI|nr:hypothetical protein DICVIV_01003 [Dictyocaulus viviparus]
MFSQFYANNTVKSLSGFCAKFTMLLEIQFVIVQLKMCCSFLLSHNNYVENERIELALKVACTISLITVCLHTPHTFELWWPLSYIVCCLDLISVLVLSSEAALRIHQEGFNMNYLFLMKQLRFLRIAVNILVSSVKKPLYALMPYRVYRDSNVF